MPSLSFATADLCDDHHDGIGKRPCIQIVQTNFLSHYGSASSFCGRIQTVRCHECNALVRETLSKPPPPLAGCQGDKCGHVLVVDASDSTRVAMLGDRLAALAVENGWDGILVNGCIRDSKVIRGMEQPLGVMARGTNPLKSRRKKENGDFFGDMNKRVAFGGVEFVSGAYLYADEDGILVSETPLHSKSKAARKDVSLLSRNELKSMKSKL